MPAAPTAERPDARALPSAVRDVRRIPLRACGQATEPAIPVRSTPATGFQSSI